MGDTMYDVSAHFAVGARHYASVCGEIRLGREWNQAQMLTRFATFRSLRKGQGILAGTANFKREREQWARSNGDRTRTLVPPRAPKFPAGNSILMGGPAPQHTCVFDDCAGLPRSGLVLVRHQLPRDEQICRGGQG